MPEKITIAVIEDHKLIRQMWAKLFSDDLRIEIVGESETLDEAIEMIKVTRPHIALLDINLAKGSGFDAVPLIRKFSPGTRIIVISMHYQPSYAKRMLRLGARAYITKNSPITEIFMAIDEVMKGKKSMCTDIKDIVSNQVINQDSVEPDIKNLSMREMEIIKLMKDGLSSKEISSMLNISSRTVEVHRYNILKKLKFKNTAALVNFVNNTDLNFP